LAFTIAYIEKHRPKFEPLTFIFAHLLRYAILEI